MPVKKGEFRSADERSDRAVFWIAAAMGSLVSLAITGFVFGTNNNLFHFPIVAELYNEPQFANDQFMQSLRHYDSVIWAMLRGSASYLSVYWAFLLLFALSRFLSFVGFLACARLLHVETRREQLFFALLVSTTYLMRGPSFAGEGGLFINYFNQSEIANGLFLLALYLALRHRIALAIAMVGAIFSVNAFFGVWTIVVLGVVFLIQILRRELTWRNLLLRGLVGIGFAGLLAAPVIASILSNPDFGKPTSFDYVSFLTEYFPYHFLFGSISLSQKVGVAFVVAIGAGAFMHLGSAGRIWLYALLAVCGIYVAGILLPFATHSQTFLNLHLLRSSTLVHLLATLAVCALATSWWFGEDRVKATVIAPILVVALTVPTDGALRFPIILALGLCLLGTALAPRIGALFPRISGIPGMGRGRLQIAMAAWLLCIISVLALTNHHKNQNDQAWIDEWWTIGAWARKSTPVTAVFETPVVSFNQKKGLSEGEAEGVDDTIFEYASHRLVWVDFKRGAAVMWSPSYYSVWHHRVSEASSKISLEEKLDYARKNNIDYVIELCDRAHRENALFATKRICLYAAS